MPDQSLAQSNLVYTRLFQPGLEEGNFAEEYRHWNRRFAEPMRKFHQPHANDRDPERRLRIGPGARTDAKGRTNHFRCGQEISPVCHSMTGVVYDVRAGFKDHPQRVDPLRRSRRLLIWPRLLPPAFLEAWFKFN